ncbi:MAG: hypothetical protein WCJ35_13280 [Planctomycetota bacterium]
MYGLSLDEWRDLLLSVNTHRSVRRLSPPEVACLTKRAVKSASLETVAQSLNMRETSTLRRIMPLAGLDADLQSLVAWGAKPGKIGFSVASELQGLREPSAIREAFGAALTNNLSKEEARQIKQAFTRGQGSISKCIEGALKTRPRIERREVVLGAITDATVVAAMSRFDAADYDSEFRNLLGIIFPGVVFIGATLNAGYFSLVLDSANAKRMRAILNYNPLEHTITEAVGRWISNKDK